MQNSEKKIDMYIFEYCAAIWQDCGHFILTFGPLKCKHTQLNLCENEELLCFLYLIQIFDPIMSDFAWGTYLPKTRTPLMDGP